MRCSISLDERDMRRHMPHPPLKDYSTAVAQAIAWLGDRYLLAKPVNSGRPRTAGQSGVKVG
jgi:hypothetical protein